MALINRALLLEQTGDLRGAVRDFSKVIDEFPNFWFGLQHRADCYRRLGQSRQAELDEFRILKAQMDKRYGRRQPRLNRQQMRRRSDDADPEKYNQIVIADDQEVEHEYKSPYRGRVQNRQTDETLLPLFCLTNEQPPATDDVRSAIAYDRHVEAFNSRSSRRPLYISTTALSPLDEQGAQPLVDSLTAVLHADSTSMIALWQRAVCHWRLARYQTSLGGNASLQLSLALADLNRALAVDPQDALLYYNRATLYAERRDYRQAISDYDRALRIEPNLAEAWYNRGLCHIFLDDKASAVSDLSKAGELGLYTAYNLIKRYR